MRLLILIAALLAVPAATARAALYPGDPVDGPGADVQSLGDLDLARDGTGALAYVKRVDGADQIFVARFVGGVFGLGERVDGGLSGPSSQPVVGAADNGRLVVFFVNRGAVYGVVRPAGEGYSGPVALGTGSDPSVDLSINGTAYASFTSGSDVRVARLDRRTNTWGLLDQPADVDPSRPAGTGTGRSRVAISADGIGVEGRVATVSDLPDIDAEDDSSYAWVVFRQTFADGGSRILARRQRGTGFEPPVAIEAPDGEPVREPNIEMNGRGVGLATTSGAVSGQPMVALLDRDVFGAGSRMFGGSVAGPAAAPAMSENNDGLVASVLGGPGEAPFVRVRTYDDRKPGPESLISRSELGPVDPARGFDVAVDRADGGVVAWVQGGADDRKIVAGYRDRPPGSFRGYTTPRCCQPALARLTWQPSFNLWGATRYEVRVDGQLVGETTDSTLQLAAPLVGATHRWQVTAIDLRGQTRRSKTRLLRVDDLAPRLSVGYKRSKRVVTVSVRGRDLGGAGHRSSGIRDVAVSWGEASPRASGTSRVRARHRYRRAGEYALEITARDKAGNVTVNKRTVRIG